MAEGNGNQPSGGDIWGRGGYGTLETKVSNLDDKFESLSRTTQAQIIETRADTRLQIDQVRREVSDQFKGVNSLIAGLSADIKEQIKGGRTQWTPVLSTVGVMAGILISGVVAVGHMAFQPVIENAQRQELLLEKLADADAKKVSTDVYIAGLAAQQARNLQLQKDVDDLGKEVHTALIAQAYINGAKEAEHVAMQRDIDRNWQRTDTIDSQLVKRPELDKEDTHNEQRFDALSARANALELWLQGLAPGLKEIINAIEQRLDRLTFTTPQTPSQVVTPVPMVTEPAQPPRN